MKQASNDYQPGVRAEPRFLRDPTSLEFISSGLTRFSSYVVSNLPKRKPSMQHYNDLQPPLLFYQQQQQQPAPPPPSPVTPISSSLEDHHHQSTKPEPEDDHDKVTFASFQHMETLSMDDTVSTRRLCLLLGYHDGFQIWDITNPDNIHEICSIRDEEAFGTVSFMHIVNSPYQQDTKDQHPLLAIVTSREPADNDAIGVMDPDHTRRASTSSAKSFHATCTVLRFYSLNTHQVIKEIHNMGGDEEEETRITAIKSNHTAVVVGCTGSSGSTLHVLSCKTLDPLSTPITDVYHDPINGPVFTLGARFLAYATHSPVLNDDLALSQHKGIGGTGLGVLQGDKDVKDIAKEVVSGVKSLSEYGYQTLSSYFGNHPQDKMQPPPPQQQQAPSVVSSSPRTISPMGMRYDERTASPIPSSSTQTTTTTTTTTAHRKAPAAGMVMIRDIAKLPTTPTRNMSLSTVAHFRPHSHPLSCLTFNAAGTLLLSASKQGHTFHIFGVLPSNNVVGNISHLYSLARGYTDAQVEDCQFSADSMWCSVSTARGTTHVYAINPYGGKPEIMGHVVGKVNNPPVRLFMNQQRKLEKSTSLGSVVRVKQRRPMITETHDDLALSQQQQQQHYPTATIPPPIPTRSSHSRQPRAKLSTMFLLPTKIPYLVHASKSSHSGGGTTNNTNGTSHSNASGSNSSKALLDGAASFKAFKQQASSSLGSMLSSFGSSISSTDSSSSFSSMRQHHAWTSAHDKLADNRLFGFDEEEMPTVEDDDSRTLHDGRIGYQDMYSIHPRGMLTLHRCWVSKSVVKKRDHSRTIELVVKQEDVAEWSMARTTEWEQVKVSLARDNNATDATATRKKKRRTPWLSNAEITTCLPDEQPLWTSSQFSLQTFSEDPATLSKKLWKTGEMPEAKPVHVRRELPEPYSSRIDRVGKTTARITSQDEENLDDALAELEDNLSKAMQTTFTTPSPTTLLSGSYGSASPAGYKRGLQQPIIPGNNGTTPSSISFEDAHLISMGSGPSPEDLLTHHQQQQQQTRGNMALHHSSLIQFDEEEEVRLPATPSMQSSSSIRLEDDDDDDDPPVMDQQVFSPDGDNEMAHPSESIFAERPPPSL